MVVHARDWNKAYYAHMYLGYIEGVSKRMASSAGGVAACVGLLVFLVLCVAAFCFRCSSPRPAHGVNEPATPFRIYVCGEPGPWESPAEYDLCILAGGHNLYANAVHLPLLALEKGWTYETQTVPTYRPIDVLFRSSARCGHERNEFAQHIRRRCQEHNLNFASVGKCLGGEGDSKSWGECDACLQAKIVLALEAFQEGSAYLSEKPFLPLAMGAAGVYVGNGAGMLWATGANPDRFVYVGNDYSQASAEKAAQAILDFLGSPTDVERCLAAPPFVRAPLSSDTLDLRGVHEYLRHSPKLQGLRRGRRRPLLCYFEGKKWSLLQHPFNLARLLQVDDVVTCDAPEGADIVLKHCCA